MKVKTLSVLAITLSLGACASVPPPPHCEDNGKAMHPINPEMLTQEQINAHRTSQKPDYQPQRGHGGRN